MSDETSTRTLIPTPRQGVLMRPLLAAALAWHAAGCAVIPIRTDGSKSPAVSWKQYQATPPAVEQLHAWFADDTFDGIGVICGAVSGNLELLELEGRAIVEGIPAALTQLMADNGLGEVWQRLNSGYLERTPSGGMHWLYRLTDGTARRNLKLARRPATDAELAEHPDDRVKVLIETRGEAGQVVVAPSAGRTHPTGGAWTLLIGSPQTIPTLTVDERDALHAVAAMLDQLPADDPAPRPATSTGSSEPGTRPGDDYNDRATWAEILEPHGWTATKRFHPGTGWTRPGKDGRDGISATTGTRDHDNLYVFSSSTVFDTEKPYSKFAAYALLEHGGDYAVAARALRAAGYGTQENRDRILNLVKTADVPVAPTTAPTDGTAALKVKQDGADIPTAINVTLTDQGNAELLIARHGHELRYVPSRGSWLRWTGQKWTWCEDDGEAIQAATATIHAIAPADDAERKHKTRSLSRRSLEAAVALARRDPRIRVDADTLDADGYALNTPSGVVDLRTGQTRPHSSQELHTKLTGVDQDHDNPAPRWLAFLTDTFGDDPEMVDFVQRLAGYSACGVVLHHVLPFLHGGGGNGKSVFLDVLVAVLGDYASTAPAGFLMVGAREDENAIARLAGLRLVVCSEVNQTARFDEAKVKLLTGGDRLTARFLYQRHFTFQPSHTLWLMGNHQPRIEAGGESFARRLRLIPFTRVVPPEKRVEGLAAQLVAEEGPQILAWILRGAQEALTDGLPAPQRVLAATRTYMDEEDALARFVADRCHLGGGHLVKIDTREVRAEYEKWCREEGERPISPQVMGRELRNRFGIDSTRSNGRRFYVGVTLLADDEPEPEPHWGDR